VILDSDRKITRVDVRQLGTVAIASTNNPLLGIIIVGTGEEVAKDKFGVPQTFLLMHTNTDTTERSIVFDSHRTHILVDGDGDGTHLFGVERVAVDSIDQDLIKYFQESRRILQVLFGELVTIKDPIGFCTQFNWTDIRVRSLDGFITGLTFNLGLKN